MEPLRSAVATTLTGILALAVPALAQSAGGVSPDTASPAPPGEQAHSNSAPRTPEQQNDEYQPYETDDVLTFKKSPTFTQDRQFTNTQVWVLDPGSYTVEQWWAGRFGVPYGATAGTTNQDAQLFQTGIEIGVLKRLQLDIYVNYEFNQNDTGRYDVVPGGHTGVAAAVRIAIPDHWGQVWANPAFSFQVASLYQNALRAEGRLLLAGTVFTPRLLAAFNFAFARNSFRDAVTGVDYEIDGDLGLNYDFIPGWFRAGAEATVGWDSHGSLNPDGTSALHTVAQVGPQLLFTVPSRYFKVLAAVLFGLANFDPPVQPTIIASCTF
jgi:hypothetical protein